MRRRRSAGPRFRRRRSPARAQLIVLLQLSIAAVAIGALLAVALRAGDDSGVPIAASGAGAGESAAGASGAVAGDRAGGTGAAPAGARPRSCRSRA